MSTQLLTIPETAARLACSRWHVYDLIRSGELEVVDISRPGSTRSTTRVRDDVLQAYLDRITVRPTPTMKG